MKRAALVAFAVLLGAACGGADATGEALVRLDEFSVNTAEIVPVGSGELVVRNVGEFGHTLVISDESGRVVVATDLIPPATEVVVAADLDPGRYQFSCRIVVQTPDGAISDHFEQGMVPTSRSRRGVGDSLMGCRTIGFCSTVEATAWLSVVSPRYPDQPRR